MLLGVSDALAAYLLDACVVTFGLIIENALHERDNIGTQKEPKYEPRYTLPQLLDPAFRLPRPQPVVPKKQGDGLAVLLAMARQRGSGVKLWTGVKPS